MIVLWSCRPHDAAGTQPATDVGVKARRWIKMRARTQKGATHGHEGQTRRRFGKNVWSALQTHLQGVHGATLAIMPEEIRHRAALLSR
jgi:hypothetical protein